MSFSPPVPSPLLFVRDEAQARSLLDPRRREILERLAEPGSASSVAAELGLPRQRVNYHVRALEQEGLLRHVEDRRKGNCVERVVRATAERYAVDPGLLGGLGLGHTLARPKLSFSADALADSAASTLRELAALQGRHEDAAAEPSEPVPSLAAEAHFASPAEEVEFGKAIRDALSALVERYHDPSAGQGRTFRITLGGHLSRTTPARTRT
jgi:DNA-binding transcriptional ArsR family regulator